MENPIKKETQDYDPKQIEEYQFTLLKNPRSPVFAVLAEAYRKMGLLQEALEISEKGVRYNPHFVSGIVAYAKVLFAMENYSECILALKNAMELNPDNLLALRLTGYCYKNQKKYDKALRVFKKVLVLCPTDSLIIDFVTKWEFLDNLDFSLSDLESLNDTELKEWLLKLPGPEASMNVIDSFLAHEDPEKARHVVHMAGLIWPKDEKIKNRMEILGMPLNSEKKSQLVEIQARQNIYHRILRNLNPDSV